MDYRREPGYKNMKPQIDKKRKEHLFWKLPAPAPQQNDLESTLKEKVSPLLEETMERQWGITIPKIESDITDQLKKPQLNVYISPGDTFPRAKKKFKKEFIKKEIQLHRGNISRLAKALGLDRRSIHRAIKDLEINLTELRRKPEEKTEHQRWFVDQTIRSTLEHYKEIIIPQKIESMYLELPELSRNIARVLPYQELKWKEAEQEFERQFLMQALEEQQWDISTTAKNIRLRPETLYRKIKKLRLRRE